MPQYATVRESAAIRLHLKQSDIPVYVDSTLTTSAIPHMPPPLPRGLDADFARKRLHEEGPNELGLSQRRTLADILLEVVREPMFLLLLGAGAIYFAMGDSHEALMLLTFVLMVMGMTAFQERRTDNALAALRDMSSPRALAIRGGEALRIAEVVELAWLGAGIVIRGFDAFGCL